MSLSENHNEIHIVTGGNEAFAIGIGVTIATALEQIPTTTSTRIHILDGGIPEVWQDRMIQAVQKIHPSATLHFYSLDRFDFRSLNPGHNGSRMYYARLAMGEILNKVNKVIYLDADTLVIGNLAELWTMNLRGKLAFACPDRKVKRLGEDCPWELSASEKEYPYFNSGVMLVDLAGWRHIGVYTQSAPLAASAKTLLKWHDQTLLNYILKGSIELLPETWNWQRNNKQSDSQELKIIHFTTPTKPWRYWGSDFRYQNWRLAYKRHFGHPLQIFLTQGSITGLTQGIWDYISVHYLIFRILKKALLWISIQFTSNEEKRTTLRRSLEFYRKIEKP